MKKTIITLISKRVGLYLRIVICVLPIGIVSAERPDVFIPGRVENRSSITGCAEVDNIDMPLYAGDHEVRVITSPGAWGWARSTNLRSSPDKATIGAA
jgi:hypothetical protein